MKTRSIIVIACGLVAVLAGAILLVLEDDDDNGASPPPTSAAASGGGDVDTVDGPGADPPDGTEAVAVDVTWTAGGAGHIAVGDEVNVLALVPDAASGAGAPRSAVMVTERVEVLAIGSGGGVALTATTAPAETVSYLLAVPVDDVERVVQAAGFYRLYLTLPTADADERDPAPSSDADLFGAVAAATVEGDG